MRREGHLDNPSPASSWGLLLRGASKALTTGLIRAFIPAPPPAIASLRLLKIFSSFHGQGEDPENSVLRRVLETGDRGRNRG
ncbi:MAG: hypothetical protein QXK53_03010 [Nitrososphaerota archaeon]